MIGQKCPPEWGKSNQRFEARAKTGNETDADPNACDSLPSD
ncbi:DUF3330 domain-containing protein [Massilia sp. TN1-12]